jgi:hypothetical protein
MEKHGNPAADLKLALGCKPLRTSSRIACNEEIRFETASERCAGAEARILPAERHGSSRALIRRRRSSISVAARYKIPRSAPSSDRIHSKISPNVVSALRRGRHAVSDRACRVSLM